MSQIIFVNIDNFKTPQDGTSWETAFSNLQNALSVAETLTTPPQIWVAEGVYIPSQVYSPNNVPGGAYGLNVPNPSVFNLTTFNLPNVTIYGGFRGGETKLCQRNPHCNKTVLSGANTFWHVVILGNDVAQTGVNATLDGLIIREGFAQGPDDPATTITSSLLYAHGNGGGIYSVFGSTLNLKRCLVESNRAKSIGGGIYSNNSWVRIYKCYFRCNFTDNQAGAVAIYNVREGNITRDCLISQCVFKENRTLLFGGAIVVEGTEPNPQTSTYIKCCEFEDNTAYEGGAIVVDSQTTVVKRCQFRKNIGYVNGGALATTNVVNTIASGLPNAQPLIKYTTTVDDCVFEENETLGNLALHDSMFGGPSGGLYFPLGGGALVCYMNGLLNVYNSLFESNIAYNSDGGAILNGSGAGQNIFGTGLSAYQVTTNVNGCIFRGNISQGNGGAIASEANTYVFTPPLNILVSDTVLNVSNSDFEHNKAVKGGAIYMYKTSGILTHNRYKCNSSPKVTQVDSLINI